jgi:hypothetical protein
MAFYLRRALLRSIVFAAVAGMALVLAGCSPSSQVSLGEHGATSPAESGEHGAYGDQAAPSQQQEATSEYDIKPIEQPLTNDNVDASMEGSGNIAAQGDYKEVVAAQQKRATPPIE